VISARRATRCPRARTWRNARVGARCAAALVALSSLAAPRAARAQLAVDHFELLLRPHLADARVGAITVRNDGATAVQAIVKIEDWDRTEDGTNRWFPVGTIGGSCGASLAVFPRAIRLEPGASQVLRVSWTPEDVPAHECWAAAVVETVRPEVQGGRQVAYVVRTAVKLYAQPPASTISGEVTALRVVGEGAPSTLEVAFANTGDTHVVAHGQVEFRRADNTVAATLRLPDLHALPASTARARVAVPRLPPGRYVALALIDYGGDDIAAMQLEHRVR
jgi:P pilus assembly chaperone PapD